MDKKYILFAGTICLAFLLSTLIHAGEMTFSGGGDNESWSDEDNWFPNDVPTLGSDVLIDLKDVYVLGDKTFYARTITIGGREDSTFASQNFVYGTVDPGDTAKEAILNRLKGKIVLKGAGTLTLKGRYKDSEEALTSEPSFLFWVK